MKRIYVQEVERFLCKVTWLLFQAKLQNIEALVNYFLAEAEFEAAQDQLIKK